MLGKKAASLLALLLVSLLALAAGACDDDSGPDGSDGDAKERVVIIHSYDGDFRWTAEQNDGIIDGLARAGYTEGEQYDLRVFYMDTRVNFTTPEQIEERAAIAIRTIDEFMPSLVFVTDDNATEYVAVAYLQEHPDTHVAFIFSGVNGDPMTYPMVASLDEPGGQLTGTLERFPFAEAFAAAAKLFEGSQRVVVFADDSSSSAAVGDLLREDLQSGATMALQVVDFVQISTFEEWKQQTASYQDEVDAIGVVNYHRVKDDSENIMPAGDVAGWMVENSDIPVFGLVSDWSADGLVMSFGNSGYKTGLYVGLRGADIWAGEAVGEMPILDPEQHEITFNVETAELMDLTIPAEDLLEAAQVYPER